MTLDLGRIGIWSSSFGWTDGSGTLVDGAREAVAELDSLGFGALWLGSADPGLGLAERLLAATGRIVVATGIVNVWMVEAEDLAARYHRLDDAHPGRFLLGLGASHGPVVQALGRTYSRPLGFLADYLDALDAAPRPVPADRRVLAALRPKALRLAGQRSAGAHPYLTTPDHTRSAREILGAGPLLAPEQKVVLTADPAEARVLARATVAYYLRLPNYVNNLLALGFTESDVSGDGSDRLVDALVARGRADQVAKRVREHLDAGADHVVVQVLVSGASAATRTGRLTRDEWRELAGALL
ncbi:LLM class F420-dependent oxidoreductase [Frankia sp. AgB1.9]|uniref:LLM class F420-dependent oxidoreductase n=1 Tax=unclassified Frankia TaxID=2632575 RepID=UPI0019314957|nr:MULTISPECIES: LLM class F420-dependent oxidoreductase [unclassified Frankia]MBL7486901.1 LLM class F420-dependent oxidoreductase [Frankia sp. AgW1.1]MBL7547212.1 LLM class F420-dependent oxidoreductase [Frankia sp. AgB1.9]MBL7623996.1 LLM class F420-dependent oxidoreductase [Frankia sp. AgB1.8]